MFMVLLLGQSSLTYTICCGRVEIVPYLLEHGASPNQPCSNGFTPFHFAVTGGKILSRNVIAAGHS
jgi:ankyrin repeat protein